MLGSLFGSKKQKTNSPEESKVLFANLSPADQKLLNTLAVLKVEPQTAKFWVEAFTTKLPREEAIAIAGELLRRQKVKNQNTIQNSHLTATLVRAMLLLPNFPLCNAVEKCRGLNQDTLLAKFIALYAAPSSELVNLFLPFYKELNLGDQGFIEKFWPIMYQSLIVLDHELRNRLREISPRLIQKSEEWLSPLVNALKQAKPLDTPPKISKKSIAHLRSIADQLGLGDEEELKTRVQELAQIWEHLALQFPEGSPRHLYFKRISAEILVVYGSLTSGIYTVHNADDVITRLIASDLNLSIAGLTPLQRLSLGSPLEEETLTKFTQRLVKEGADLKAVTIQYPINWKITLQEVWSNFPWPTLMLPPLIHITPLTPQQLAERYEPRLYDLLAQLADANKEKSDGLEAYRPTLEWTNVGLSTAVTSVEPGADPANHGRKRSLFNH